MSDTKPTIKDINVQLKNQLELILNRDQGIREIIEGNLSDTRKNEILSTLNIDEKDVEGNKKFNLMKKIDEQNLREVEKIIKLYGYPGKNMVGEPANKAVFYVIQHSDKIEEYLPLIRNAAEKDEIKKTWVALMEDRYLMEQGREQIYGTQVKGKYDKHGNWVYFLWPIKDFDSVDYRRKKAGFKETLEMYLKEMDVPYRNYKINEVNGI